MSFSIAVLTLLVPLASALSIPHLDKHLFERADPDPFTPHGGPFVWYALGDSYTAGPGAGALDPSNKDDCVRSVGSYARQLQNNWLYTGENQLNFLACTGAVSGGDDPNVIEGQLPEISSEPPSDLTVLTIGGNDIGFGPIAKSCLVNVIGSGNCDTLIAAARTTMASAAFLGNLDTIYDGIFAQMPNDYHYQVIQIGYSKFFNADDDSTWCNTQTFGKFPFSVNKPPLTLDLRRKLNSLTDDFNSQLYSHLLAYVQKKLSDHGPDGWTRTRLFYMNYDSATTAVRLFDGHKFCEPGVEDPQFGDPSTWFFGVWGKQPDAASSSSNTEVGPDYFANITAATCNADPKYKTDDAFAWDCDMATYYASPGADQTATTVPGLDILRSFHPKTTGFGVIKDRLVRSIQGIRKVPPIGQCIPAVGPDLANIASVPSGASTNLCATGSATGILNPGPTITPSKVSSIVSPVTSAAAPLGSCNSKCNCNEDGCTPDSPDCCGNGTCDNSC